MVAWSVGPAGVDVVAAAGRVEDAGRVVVEEVVAAAGSDVADWSGLLPPRGESTVDRGAAERM